METLIVGAIFLTYCLTVGAVFNRILSKSDKALRNCLYLLAEFVLLMGGLSVLQIYLAA